MGLTSEQVHWIFGAALLGLGALLLLRALGGLQGRGFEYLIPAGLLAAGVEMSLDPLVHGRASPGGYGAETAQHLALGAVFVACGAAEALRVRLGKTTRAWRAPLVVALLVAAGVFAGHAQHDSPAPMILLVTQHRVIAATLLAAALALVLAPPDLGRRAIGFPLLVLVLGAQFLLYSEGTTIFGPLPAMSPGHSMTLR